jgi:CRP/FNR family cyclic AMP-dependent transcriptional regulator
MNFLPMAGLGCGGRDNLGCEDMSSNILVPLLSQTDLFAGFAAEELAACAAAFRRVRFNKGALLFTRGAPGTHLYIVIEGRVRLAITNEEGRELSFRHAATGDLFGEIAAIDGSPRTADATALTEVTAYALERNAFRELWSIKPGIATGVIAFLCSRLRATSSQLEAIALHPLEVRLARFLLVALGDRQAAPGKRVPLELGFSQGELAQLLGASRPKVNTALGALESAGAINRTLDRIFCDRVKLAQIAREDDV